MTADEAIGILTGVQTMVLNRNPDKFVQAVNRAILALDSERQRKDPQPLTIKELRQMDGEPVWIKADHYGIFADVVKIRGREDGGCFVGGTICYRLQENGYGKTWNAYRHKPKEG